MTGWTCPNCGAGIAPHIATCPACPPAAVRLVPATGTGLVPFTLPLMWPGYPAPYIGDPLPGWWPTITWISDATTVLS